MGKIKLALCIEDREYQNRFTNCILNHYQSKFELHVFTKIEEYLQHQKEEYHGVIISGYENCLREIMNGTSECVVYLYHEDSLLKEPIEGVIYVDKYQEVNKIMENVLGGIKEEVRQVVVNGELTSQTKFIGVYALSQNEYQMPIAMTMASIYSEREKVLFLDLQGNSGLSQLATKEYEQGLEELLVMAESGKISQNRILSCIGHLDHIDYIYPAKSIDRLCEADVSSYLKLLQMITKEMEYSLVIINFGVRFVGFFELMNRCKRIYYLWKEDEMSKWRELELQEEMRSSGYEVLVHRLQRLDVGTNPISVFGCERVVEQWKWNNIGNYIRSML